MNENEPLQTTNEEMNEESRPVRRLHTAPPSPFIARLILDTDVFNDKQLNMKNLKQAIRQVDDGYIIQAKM